MNKLLVAAALLGIAAIAHARPVIIEETSRIQSPDPLYSIGAGLAIDGDEAVVIGLHGFIDSEGYSDTESTAFLFRRSGTSWTFVKRLGSGFDSGVDDMHGHYGAAMSNGVMALAMQPLQVFEKLNGDWVSAPALDMAGNPITSDLNGDDVVIEGNRIFHGGLSWGGVTFERNSAGEWRLQQALYGDDSGLSDSAHGGPVDMVADWAAILNPYNSDEFQYGPTPAITLFLKTSPSSTSWVQQARLVPDEGHTFGDVALRRNDNGDYEMFVPDYNEFGTAWYRTDASGTQWGPPSLYLHSAGEFMDAEFGAARTSHGVTRSGRFVFRHVWDYDRHARVIEVFLPNENGFWTHRATLVGRNRESLGSVSASGNRVLATGGGGLMYFELPSTFTTPAVIQHDFATGNGAGWTPVPGSQWSVAQVGDTRVYRQSNTSGDAGAVLDAADWTDQSIQVDVKPTAFNGNDRWVGLATRRTDASNFYYVTLRSSGIVALRRMFNGQFGTLASASLPVTLNRTYRLRLESIGTRHRVYVDGAPLLDVDDDELTHGHPALLMYRAAADYDNVVVTPSNLTTIYAQSAPLINYDPPRVNEAPWIYADGTWTWRQEGTNQVLSQSDTSGNARTAAGPLNEVELDPDQIVEVRARLASFGGGSDPWFGVMARYRDDRNYLYMSLRRSNTLTLRRVVDGQIVQLGTVVLNVTPGAWYRLRLEAVGNRVRAFVNEKLRIEATDPQPFNGRQGLVTYRAAADYDDYRAIRP
ncbi:MAG TPA: hypothetical protein VFS13_03760 [Steroidobacteraceae bacterium]|nr:hypothetical protein [Steroidobacteraceae bacterium]